MATRASVKNEKQYEALKDKGMSKQRAAKIANNPKSSEHGGQQSGKGGDSKQGGTTAQKKEAGRKGGKAAAKKAWPPRPRPPSRPLWLPRSGNNNPPRGEGANLGRSCCVS